MNVARVLPLFRGRRLSLRDRVASGFALMALLLAVVLAGASWLLVSSYVDRHLENTAVAQTVDNALLLKGQLRHGYSASTTLVNRLKYPPGAAALLVYDGRSYPSQAAVRMRLPRRLHVHVREGAEVLGRRDVGGDHYLVVGVPLGRHGNALFELYPLTDLQQTLSVLWVVLVLGAAGIALLGLAVGRHASRRLLRPLSDVTAAAAAIAHGDLSARLSADIDPDLADLARSFNRTAAALEHRVRADARFAGDVSHELRTPLTTMLNSVALLQNRRAELPAHLVEPIDLLAEDLQRFRKLVVDLLDISRSDGGYGAQHEPVLVADLVRRAADTAAGRPATVVEPQAEGVVMRADKRRLERVLTNLVENAEIHGRGCQAVRVSASDGRVRIEVDDRGQGIDEDRRDRIFDRFARDSSEGAPGTGLGLAIVARHVQWHGGDVHVENRPEGGARFVVELPVMAEGRSKRVNGVQRAGAILSEISLGDGAAAGRATGRRGASRRPGSPGRRGRT